MEKKKIETDCNCGHENVLFGRRTAGHETVICY